MRKPAILKSLNVILYVTAGEDSTKEAIWTRVVTLPLLFFFLMKVGALC